MNPTDDLLTIDPERFEFLDAFPNAEQTRRDFFRLAGSGVIVALLMGREVTAQPPGRGGGRQFGGGGPREIGAWIHIGEDSAVTVYTGKVEIGQNIRTSLSQVVAEELHAPFKSIRMVMADTSAVPYDAGTFGSRTTPTMAPQLRRAAAAARETLLDLAAEQSKARAQDAHRGRRQSDRPRRQTVIHLRRTDQGPEADEGDRRHGADRPGQQVDGGRHFRSEGGWARLRHRGAPVRLRHAPARHALRQGAPALGVQREARLGGHEGRGGDAGAEGGSRGRVRRRRRPDGVRRSRRRRQHQGGVAKRTKQVAAKDLCKHFKDTARGGGGKGGGFGGGGGGKAPSTPG